MTSTGYSGKPIHVLVGVSKTGEIVGARMVDHSEPIVLIGIPDRRIQEFIQGYIGFNVLQMGPRARPAVDIVAGATVTVVVIGETMTRAALRVLRSRGDAPAVEEQAGPERALDMTREGTRTWEELLGDGSVRRLLLTVGQVNEDFAASDERAARRPERGEVDDVFIDLYVAPVTPPVIGRSLLGEQAYAELMDRLGENQHAIMVMGQGRYSFRGSGFVRGGLFDRIELIQDEAAIRFRDRDYVRRGDVAAEGAPGFPEIGLFVAPASEAFNAAEPWRLQLLVQREIGALERTFLTYDVAYDLPKEHLVALPPPEPAPPPAAEGLTQAELDEPLWVRMWEDKLVAIGVLIASLTILSGVFFFQDILAKHPIATERIRTGFLLFTLVWLGWYSNAQLSVVNILTLTNSLITDFSWDYFLMDPLLFILWAAVAASLLFWARGAFCGWLCPFGALQEFVNRIARFFKVPQITVPWGLHERLWAIKYLIFLGLFGLSVYSLAWAERLAEVEPFKTAIILKFAREWPFVVYALTLLAASMFIERFFCRYLCPLGAALAIPARLRMFDWLKRHRECGSPCQRCAVECPVSSIHPNGQINVNECISCLHCQTLYWDDQRCPHMIQLRLKRERAQAISSPGGPPKRAATTAEGTQA
ncbi:MAG: 4Fe-4S binding protein [Rhodospirillaceae bacterium]